ncbi:hypothetical protein NGM99_18840 [Mesorhizobium sp. RP14(2022)]|uniref:DUF721 domain-containing protein n=1 Tax=Mesorhizobium liriopis TaxID=2953882 RepID=A0ABT1CAM3_9HYPH|nr:hypothetical protein [Mesorhizobium liriopis]
MSSAPAAQDTPVLQAEWPLAVSVTLGSAVRAKGIGQELRARLPVLARLGLKAEAGRLVLSLAQSEEKLFEAASAIVERNLVQMAVLPVLPREVEDILAIAPRERLKWTKDGRLQSAGTRTVKLRGRAKAVTFHVFDPRFIEDVLDRDMPALWREEDKETASQNRKRAAGKAALKRKAGQVPTEAASEPLRPDQPAEARPRLKGWDAFSDDGLLR